MGSHCLGALAVSLTLLGTVGAAENKVSCVNFLPQVESAFQDIHGKIPEDERTQLKLVSECAFRARLCVVAEDTEVSGYRLVEGKLLSDHGFAAARNLMAVSMLGVFRTRDQRYVCTLARYGGGSAATWVVDAWYKSAGVVRTINTDKVSIHADVISPEALIRVVSKSVYEQGGFNQ